MRILDNTKSLTILATDTTNGIGAIMPIEAYVEEELNGIFEAEIRVAISDNHFKDLKVGGLMRMSANDTDSEQIFRIYSMDKNIDNTCTIRLQHITYDLGKIPVLPFNSQGAVDTKNNLLSHMVNNDGFTMTTDITNTTSQFVLDIPRSFRECLGGYEGSVLDTFRCEYKWDNLNVGMLAKRGSDNGVRIAYGKNLTDFRQEENNENVFDGVLGYAVIDETTYVGNPYNKTGANKPHIMIVDFSDKYSSDNLPSVASLTQNATDYATNNDIEVPNINISVSFVNLAQTEEYKNILPLERVSLGDVVHVYFEKLGVEASARVIRTKWNCLLSKYDEIELGDTRANLNSVISQSVSESVDKAIENLDIDTSAIEGEMRNLTSLIANGLGLHISKDSAGRIILHNATTISGSQYQYMISASGFMLSEDYGQTWSSGWDISGNAVLNSLSTITLKALEIYGSYIQGSQIVFGDINDKYIIVHSYDDTNNDPVGIMFEGTGDIRMKAEGRYDIQNTDGTYIWNQMYFYHNDDGSVNNEVHVYNYNNTNNIKNSINMLVNSTLTRSTFRMDNWSYSYSKRGNQINMYAEPTNNMLSIYNNIVNSSLAANFFYMENDQSNNIEIIQLVNYKTDESFNLNNQFLMASNYQGNARNEIRINNYAYGSGNTDLVNQIMLKSDGGISIDNYLNNNSITLNSNGITLANGGGNLTLTTVNCQWTSNNDIDLTATDDIRIYASMASYVRLQAGEFQFVDNDGRKTLYFSNGYVRYNE